MRRLAPLQYWNGVVLLGACALLLACGPNSPPAGPPGERSYVHSLDGAPGSLDPARAGTLYANFLVVNLYDTLVYPTATGDPVPHVATSWDVTEDSLQ